MEVLFVMARLDGKVAIITGGAGGMGKIHAKRFIEEGAKVVIADINDEGQELANELGDNSLFVKLDVTDEQSWKDVVNQTIDKFGKVDVLVNNAGISNYTSKVEEYDVNQYKRMIDINQLGVFLGMKHVMPNMKENKSGSIINISSISGLRATPNGIGYSASKFAVTGMTKSVALEVAELGIRVNSVHPGIIKTDMTNLDILPPEVAEVLQPHIDRVPSKRMAEPEEVTNLVLYLASDESSYSTGAEFVVDGGSTAQ